MSILVMLVVGLAVGALARLIMPGKDPGGLVVTMLLGLAGSFVAGMVGRELGWYSTSENTGILASVLGAVALLAVYRMVVDRRTRLLR